MSKPSFVSSSERNLSPVSIQSLRPSYIREVANAGMHNKDVIAFWFGESTYATPTQISDKAISAITSGETFYTQNLGLPQLRQELSSYISKLHGHTEPDKIAVTSAGVSAIMLAAQSVMEKGDKVVALVPLWPNIVEIPKILGCQVECVSLNFNGGSWGLDLDLLLTALTPDVKAVLINSPNNPTGWTMSRAEQISLVEHCRKHNIWIISDEVYERLHYESEEPASPSFIDITDRNERIICINSFSKSWLMTGWRLGWIVAPTDIVINLEKLIEYNTSCAPAFIQLAGVEALKHSEKDVAEFRSKLRQSRDFLVTELSSILQEPIASPQGAMYLFFPSPSQDGSLSFCKRLVSESGLGLAPGLAFGSDADKFLRWCYACERTKLEEGLERFQKFLNR
ncbi:pyridoxal phosphate-dependent aminotransferase [Pseudomonas sp. DCB_AW]|uniref:pyridoxal phosphate-dependent aminotransferase n=1 Tax=Pseudomonas sp. DCB_AW TaxID=2993596 RepID=UPI002249869C|nr:pyridoxal phosphate-dependent aminotransferase [Pseudomonas sp. DCB_AW]MCX2684643.1 pyridoxal phosphate-dependent aminotransferase [Pseudomonas sp. DCB_AW]